MGRDAQCVWLDHAGKALRALIVYEKTEGSPCPQSLASGDHVARVHDIMVREWRDEGARRYRTDPESSLNDPDIVWPTECPCGYRFTSNAKHSIGHDALYVDAAGNEMRWQDMPNGAMMFAPWLDDIYQPQREHVINVKLPDGSWWTIDAQASNCTIADDTRQKRHHCWVIEPGAPLPNITVGKSGPTCAAGAGSILSSNWHGFLRNGILQEC